ncbi:MAG: S8 family serine peptidase [Acidobacteriota bacterium]
MSVESRALVELLLLGPSNDRRQLQDSPVLGDVWISFAVKPAEPVDLLVTPSRDQAAGPVAKLIADRIRELDLPRTSNQAAQVAYLQGLVAARLFIYEVLRVIVPMSLWWHERKIAQEISKYKTRVALNSRIKTVMEWAQADSEDAKAEKSAAFADFKTLDRFASLAGIILWAGTKKPPQSIGEALDSLEDPNEVVSMLRDLFGQIQKDLALHGSASRVRAKSPGTTAQIFQISLNRRAMPALDKSVPAVKGDAARTLFRVKCDDINWAILDSGIDGNHRAFNDEDGNSRIIKAFDFSNIRNIVSLDNLDTDNDQFKDRLRELLRVPKKKLSAKEATGILKELAEDADNDRPMHWELVEKFIEIDPRTPPPSAHGTHVAGILGASRPIQKASAKKKSQEAEAGGDWADGMCPDIKFYDLRVLARTLQDTEFAIIAALQYIRYLNDRHTHTSIHGANLSLSIPHDVRNYACGRTPICNECERLVEGGVVVVAAAGNLGYQRFETKDGSYEGYTAFSVTDPGNADGVITVGATHRYRPHTYGVSFFSSRGPTGDGRMKPDLVAPGERVKSTLPENGWGELDGTSMSAPHVSGAAAMLMARYTELIGEPRRIKQILCHSATDLGRERSFQGHGMLDVLRAFQEI